MTLNLKTYPIRHLSMCHSELPIGAPGQNSDIKEPLREISNTGTQKERYSKRRVSASPETKRSKTMDSELELLAAQIARYKEETARLNSLMQQDKNKQVAVKMVHNSHFIQVGEGSNFKPPNGNLSIAIISNSSTPPSRAYRAGAERPFAD
ncbi:hypothetical protein R1flu_000955 [Riccia fluitans]|uniref:Uncharacterized protein n=1 Tax=Riccia fluitans TaxID=41844 RepID=A0ABD1Y2C2_9MARC